MRDLWTAAILATALILLTLSAVAIGQPALPVGPPDHDRTEACGGGFVLYHHLWDLADGTQFNAYGQQTTRLEHGPVLVRYVTPGDNAQILLDAEVWLTLPDAAPEALTFRALQARYPRPCSLVEAVAGTGRPKSDL